MSATSAPGIERRVPPSNPLAHLDRDLPAGLVVFLVATPLCLGIAQASGAPLLAGLVAGIVGGTVTATLSGSQLSVSGPAAGLAVIVASAGEHLGFRGLLLATSLAGAVQIALGALRLGGIAHFFPNAVIKGMLAAIGILIVLKQIPHALGYDPAMLVDEDFREGLLGPLGDALGDLDPAVLAITAACTASYFAWPVLQRGVLRLVPVQLVAVVLGGLLATLFATFWPGGALGPEHLVALPVFRDLADIRAAVVTPDIARIADPEVWTAALTIGIVASIESLLSIEAVDRLDPHRRISPPNRELFAQGAGNLVCGLVGGLPITSVIVRSSANVQAGGETRMSAIVHGVLLLVGVLFLSGVLNRVPLAALAVVLIGVGLKLTTPSLWRSMWRAGPSQFIPFGVTIAAVVSTDLLRGTLLGLVVGLGFAIRRQQRNAVGASRIDGATAIRFHKDLTFLQKARIKDVLRAIPDDSLVLIDRSHIDFVDDDIEEILAEFHATAPERGIRVEEDLNDQVRARRTLLTTTAGH